jgi:hypothetical protein
VIQTYQVSVSPERDSRTGSGPGFPPGPGQSLKDHMHDVEGRGVIIGYDHRNRGERWGALAANGLASRVFAVSTSGFTSTHHRWPGLTLICAARHCSSIPAGYLKMGLTGCSLCYHDNGGFFYLGAWVNRHLTRNAANYNSKVRRHYLTGLPPFSADIGV